MRTITELQKEVVKELSGFYYFFRRINYTSLFMVIFAAVLTILFLYFSFKIPTLFGVVLLLVFIVVYLLRFHFKLSEYWKKFNIISKKLDSYSEYFSKVETMNNLSSLLNDILFKENSAKKFDDMLETVLFRNKDFINLLKEFDDIIKKFMEKELDDFSNGEFEFKFANSYSNYIRLYSEYMNYYENYLRKTSETENKN